MDAPHSTAHLQISPARAAWVTAAAGAVSGLAALIFLGVTVSVSLQNACTNLTNSATCGQPVSTSSYYVPCSAAFAIGFVAVLMTLRGALSPELSRHVGWLRIVGLTALIYAVPYLAGIVMAQIIKATPGTDDTWRSQGFMALGAGVLVCLALWTLLTRWVVNRRVA